MMRLTDAVVMGERRRRRKRVREAKSGRDCRSQWGKRGDTAAAAAAAARRVELK
jgi:hypothetical protein